MATIFFLSVHATIEQTQQANELGLAIMPVRDITPPGFLWIDRREDGAILLKSKVREGHSDTIGQYESVPVAYENAVSLLSTAAIQPWRLK